MCFLERNSVFIFLESSLFSAIFKTYYDKTKTLILCRNCEVISPLLEHCNVLCLVMDSVTKAIGTLKGYFPPPESQSLVFFSCPYYIMYSMQKTQTRRRKGGQSPVATRNVLVYFLPFVLLNIKVFPPFILCGCGKPTIYKHLYSATFHLTL